VGCCILPSSAGKRRTADSALGLEGHLGVASSRLLREMNGIKLSRKVWLAVEAVQRSRCGGWPVFPGLEGDTAS
jgi:hypothetical protein